MRRREQKVFFFFLKSIGARGYETESITASIYWRTKVHVAFQDIGRAHVKATRYVGFGRICTDKEMLTIRSSCSMYEYLFDFSYPTIILHTGLLQGLYISVRHVDLLRRWVVQPTFQLPVTYASIAFSAALHSPEHSIPCSNVSHNKIRFFLFFLST